MRRTLCCQLRHLSYQQSLDDLGVLLRVDPCSRFDSACEELGESRLDQDVGVRVAKRCDLWADVIARLEAAALRR